MPQRKEKPEKRKYVLFESVVLLTKTNEDGVDFNELYNSKELVEINDNMINSFSTNPRFFGDTPVCDVKFLERDSDGEIETTDWLVTCTIEQATHNIELAYRTMCEFIKETPSADKIEL